ncbi:hypothetical protein M9458_027428, partial [Cirrhinus mrigala]
RCNLGSAEGKKETRYPRRMLWRRVDAGWWKGINGHKLMPITVPCFSIGNTAHVFVSLVIASVPSEKLFRNLQAKQ